MLIAALLGGWGGNARFQDELACAQGQGTPAKIEQSLHASAPPLAPQQPLSGSSRQAPDGGARSWTVCWRHFHSETEFHARRAAAASGAAKCSSRPRLRPFGPGAESWARGLKAEGARRLEIGGRAWARNGASIARSGSYRTRPMPQLLAGARCGTRLRIGRRLSPP